jgi:hypothetical protein
VLQVAVSPLVSVERSLYYVGVGGGVVVQWAVSGGDGFSD